MRKLVSLFAAAVMSVGMVSASSVASYSAPMVPLSIEGSNPVKEVRDGGNWRMRHGWRGGGGHWRGDRGWRGNRGWHGNRGWRGDRYWYRGHRGYRDYRPGYRYYNGAWFPLAAFAGALIIGNAVNNDRVVSRGSSYHTRWCYNRYRSYRAYDNTYQPNNGPRRQCVSR